VTRVVGYADQRLHKPDAPLDPSNRRISLIVHYLDSGKGKQPDLSGISGQAAPADATANDQNENHGTAPPGKTAPTR
jgi:hypothetical protein